MANPVVIKVSCEVNEGTLEDAFAKIEERAMLCAKRVKETLTGVPGAESLNVVVQDPDGLDVVVQAPEEKLH